MESGRSKFVQLAENVIGRTSFHTLLVILAIYQIHSPLLALHAS